MLMVGDDQVPETASDLQDLRSVTLTEIAESTVGADALARILAEQSPHQVPVPPSILPPGTSPLPAWILLVVFCLFVLKIHTRCDLACDHCYVYRADRPGLAESADRNDRGDREPATDRIAELRPMHTDPNHLNYMRLSELADLDGLPCGIYGNSKHASDRCPGRT